MNTPRIHYLIDDPAAGRWGLRLAAGGAAVVAPGAAYPIADHPDTHRFHWERGRVLREWQLVLIAAGEGDYEDRDGARRLAAGDGFLLAPGRWHRYRPDPAIGWHERWIAFGGPAVRRLADEGRLDPAWHLHPDRTVRAWLDEILALLDHRLSRWREQAEALTIALLARLDGLRSDPAEHPLRAAAQALEADPERPVAALARSAGLSPSRFRERFRALHGACPRRYRQQVLAGRACRLLADPEATIAEVAQALGFEDPAHFTRAFRRACGMTPSAWRTRTG